MIKNLYKQIAINNNNKHKPKIFKINLINFNHNNFNNLINNNKNKKKIIYKTCIN